MRLIEVRWYDTKASLSTHCVQVESGRSREYTETQQNWLEFGNVFRRNYRHHGDSVKFERVSWYLMQSIEGCCRSLCYRELLWETHVSYSRFCWVSIYSEDLLLSACKRWVESESLMFYQGSVCNHTIKYCPGWRNGIAVWLLSQTLEFRYSAWALTRLSSMVKPRLSRQTANELFMFIIHLDWFSNLIYSNDL